MIFCNIEIGHIGKGNITSLSTLHTPLSLLPFWDSFHFVVHEFIAFMAGLCNFSVSDCLQDGTTLFNGMRTPRKLTSAYIIIKFGKTVLYFFKLYHFISFYIDCGKSRSICHISTVYFIQFTMTGGMPAPAEFTAYFCRLYVEFREYRIQKRFLQVYCRCS